MKSSSKLFKSKKKNKLSSFQNNQKTKKRKDRKLYYWAQINTYVRRASK